MYMVLKFTLVWLMYLTDKLFYKYHFRFLIFHWHSLLFIHHPRKMNVSASHSRYQLPYLIFPIYFGYDLSLSLNFGMTGVFFLDSYICIEFCKYCECFSGGGGLFLENITDIIMYTFLNLTLFIIADFLISFIYSLFLKFDFKKDGWYLSFRLV